MSIHSDVRVLLTRLRDRWRARNELALMDQGELSDIAREFGMTTSDLGLLVERGPDAANLLYERLQVLGLSREDIDRTARGLMRDLEKTCACCNEKGICERDLNEHPGNPDWKAYCPNAIALENIRKP